MLDFATVIKASQALSGEIQLDKLLSTLIGEGSGLGLDINKKIIDKHNGKITVKSQPGQTTFSVFLPIELSKLETA
ncbi:MAG: ATP-binding protein [Coleofasciculaceae cyanobacterium]